MSARPNPLPRLYRWRTNVIQIPVLTVMTAVCGSISLLASFADKEGSMQHRIARFWARAVVWAPGVPLPCGYGEVARDAGGCLRIEPHFLHGYPGDFRGVSLSFRILAKKELWPIAFIGWYLDRSGQLPIDTANPHWTRSSLGVAVKALRAGMPVFVFPEGGRTEDGELRPFLSVLPTWPFARRCRWCQLR